MLRNKLTGVKSSILALAFASVANALEFAADAGAEAAPAKTGNGGTKPSTAVQAKRNVVQPVLDIDAMSEEQVREALRRMQSQQRTGMTRSFRFNDGSEATFYNAGDRVLDSNGRATGQIAKGGEVKSARDSGTISIYGWRRQPISLYPNEWLELFTFAPDIVQYIRDNKDHIDEHIRKRSKGDASNDVNLELANELLATFEAPLELTTLRGQIKAYDPELLDLLPGSGVVADEVDEGIVHSVETTDAEVGGES